MTASVVWSRLQIQRSGFDSRRYQILWEVVGLERGPLILVSTFEKLLGRKSSGFGIERRKYGYRISSRWPRGTLYPQELALTSPTSDGCSIGIVRIRALGFTQPLTEMSTGNIKKKMFLGSKVRPVRAADNLVSRLCRQCGILNIWQPYRPPRPVKGIALIYF
jgi:hypothetical protein